MFMQPPLDVMQNLFTLVPHPGEGADDIGLRLDVAGVVLAHAFRLVGQQVGHL